MTISASPTVEDDRCPDIGPVAVLTMAPSICVQTSDDRPGAELVDVVASALLGSGFALVNALETAELSALALLSGRRANLGGNGNLLAIHEPGGMFYDCHLGHPAPGSAAQRTPRRAGQQHLALERRDRYGQLTAASRAGEIVGAQLPLTWPQIPAPDPRRRT